MTNKLEKYKVRISEASKFKSLWKGPYEDGLTQSLIARFLVCRERFKVHAIDGLGPPRTYSYPMDFGNIWHVCEESYSRGNDWKEDSKIAVRKLMEKLPTDREEINLMYHKVIVTFKEYLEHWNEKLHNPNRKHILHEQLFNVKYLLPSGREVLLRGKIDSVFNEYGIWTQENKGKSSINRIEIINQLKFDLQTMFYTIVLFLGNLDKRIKPSNIKGVLYNVVKRSAHKVTKKENLEEFCTRLSGIIKESPDEWFDRIEVEISHYDVKIFRETCLDPILEQICDWWDLMNGIDKQSKVYHWRHPYGVYNIIDEGSVSNLDNYITTKSKVGLEQKTTLFPELETE